MAGLRFIYTKYLAGDPYSFLPLSVTMADHNLQLASVDVSVLCVITICAWKMSISSL